MDKYKEAKLKRESVISKNIVLRRSGLEDQLNILIVDCEKDPLLKTFLSNELGIKEIDKGTPPHVDIMKKRELVDYESASDIGHFRFYPKGALIKDLLEDLAEDIAVKRLKAIKIYTPLLYRMEQKDIADQAASFHERDYKINLEKRQLLLRFAGDFGLFSMMKDANLNHKNLPLRIYEISDSFRYEQSGACSGLKRLRGFTMPDIHCFCKDLDSALEEFSQLYKFYDQLLHEAGLPFAVAFRVVDDFWKTNKDFVVDRLKESKKDGLVEILDKMKHYWNLKHEFQYIDSTKDNFQLSTVQLDISDSERYGLKYIESSGDKKPVVIVHSSMGSIERMIGAILEERAKEAKKGEKATLPYWLSPTQLRLIPVSNTYTPNCKKIANYFEEVRIDIDDRDMTVGKKVRSAEKEWIPSYIVIGEKEYYSNKYNLKLRGQEFKTTSLEGKSLSEIQSLLKDTQSSRPFRKSYLDEMVSKQLRFGSEY
jgi:threonyl-tRNA synthetase